MINICFKRSLSQSRLGAIILSTCMLLATSSGFGQTTHSKLSGGGDLNPNLKVPYKAQQEYLDLRVGLSVHWGPSSLGGKEISWSRGEIIPREVYDNYYKEFNPDKFDANQWCELMKRWGVKFISPTAKHHDGFALWFSKHSEYDMEVAARKIDIMRELQKACKKHGIVLGTYYSNLDWFHPDWAPYMYGGPGDIFPKQDDSPNLERYFEYMEKQVIELIKDYEVKFIQFDGEWDSTYTHEVGSRLYKRFREADPNVLLSNRIDIGRRSQGASNHMYIDGQVYCGDFLDRERLVNHGNNVTEWYDDAWQAWVTIDKTQWSYNKTPQLMSSRELIDDAISVLGSNGNYMINLGPRPDGSFDAQQIALMDSLGMWLNHHQEAIYGTRGGPYYPFAEGVSTKKGKKAWLFITDRKANKVSLPSLNQKITKAVMFGTNQRVDFSNNNSTTTFTLAPAINDQIRVIELSFAQKVEMGTRHKIANTFEQNGFRRLTNNISYTASSSCQWTPDKATQDLLLMAETQAIVDYAFHTDIEPQPHIIIDMGSSHTTAGLIIHNRAGEYAKRSENIAVWTSIDGKQWHKQWKSDKLSPKWEVALTSSSMGAQVMGQEARYIKVGLDSQTPQYFHLPRIEVYIK